MLHPQVLVSALGHRCVGAPEVDGSDVGVKEGSLVGEAEGREVGRGVTTPPMGDGLADEVGLTDEVGFVVGVPLGPLVGCPVCPLHTVTLQ